MTEKTRFQSYSGNISTPNEMQLNTTMEQFLAQEEKEPRIWNFATITGLAMIFVGLTALIQLLFPNFGPGMHDLIEALPFIGGILVFFVGMGWISGSKEKVPTLKIKNSGRLENGVFTGTDYSNQQSDDQSGMKEVDIEEYALSMRKKLYRSRMDKKIFGVCGGLAQYFGLSSTMVRFLFAAGTILYGSFFFLYFILAIVMPKIPEERVYEKEE